MDSFIDISYNNKFFEDENVDFSDFCDIIEKPKNELKKDIEYDHDTRERYRVLRKRKMDPIIFCELEDENAFIFKYKWDPYTGERLEEDKDGPLYFDPDILIKYFHTKRLDKLWVAPSDEHGGLFQGYYDDGVGAGEDFFLTGRGYHPEWYIFRIPILDCYLTKDNNKQFITFGPKLTDQEIVEIEKLANKRPLNYKNLFGQNRPSITSIKKLYDNAISRTPNKEINIDDDNLEQDTTQTYNKINRLCVDSLIKIKG